MYLAKFEVAMSKRYIKEEMHLQKKIQEICFQGSYRQVSVKFKDF